MEIFNNFTSLLFTRVFIAALIAVIITIIICFLLNTIIMPFTRLKGIKKAELKGRMVHAILTKTITPYIVDNSESGIHTSIDGIYQYEYKGKKYQYKGHFHRTPPTDIKLYFRNDPSKARTDLEYGRLESEWKIIFVISLIVIFISTFIFF